MKNLVLLSILLAGSLPYTLQGSSLDSYLQRGKEYKGKAKTLRKAGSEAYRSGKEKYEAIKAKERQRKEAAEKAGTPLKEESTFDKWIRRAKTVGKVGLASGTVGSAKYKSSKAKALAKKDEAQASRPSAPTRKRADVQRKSTRVIRGGSQRPVSQEATPLAASKETFETASQPISLEGTSEIASPQAGSQSATEETAFTEAA